MNKTYKSKNQFMVTLFRDRNYYTIQYKLFKKSKYGRQMDKYTGHEGFHYIFFYHVTLYHKIFLVTVKIL